MTFSPSPTLPLTINSTVNITATSTSKTLSEVLLFQTVSDPSDTPLYAVTQSPFSIPYTPTRLGTAFTAFAVFTDNTFATLPLNYSLTPSGNTLALSIQAPAASLPIGLTTIVPAQAGFSNGVVTVTNVATYTTGSGGTNVFSIGTGGAITTTGNGIDSINVTYGGVSASAQISVGSCSFALSPVNQVVNYAGASISVQVTTQSGCAWTAASDSSWLTLTQAAGSGVGGIYRSSDSKYYRRRANGVCNHRQCRRRGDPTGYCLFLYGQAVVTQSDSGRRERDIGRVNHMSHDPFQQCFLGQRDNTHVNLSRIHSRSEHELTITIRYANNWDSTIDCNRGGCVRYSRIESEQSALWESGDWYEQCCYDFDTFELRHSSVDN